MRGTGSRHGGGWRVAVAAALALAGASAATGGVWVVDDGVRLDPVTGRLIEERHEAGEISPGYRQSNPVWSSAEGTVRLLAAGNEVVAFQVVVDGGPATGVSLEVSDLAGPTTLAAAEHVRRFKEWFVQVTGESAFCGFAGEGYVSSLGPGWYPDPLIPLDEAVGEGFGQPFAIPDGANAIPGQTAAAFWVDVLVPAGTTAGTYRGTVTVRSSGATTALALELEVRDLTLPAENHAGLGSVNYGGLAFDVLWGEPDPPHPDGVERWFQLAHAHRFELDAHWLWPPVEDGVAVDWELWRDLWAPFMTGSAFTAARGYWGPSPGEPIRRFTLPQDFNWPSADGDGDHRPDDVAFWQQSLRELEAVMIGEGWTGVEAQLFIHPTDEPRTQEQFDLIAHYGQLLDQAGLVDRGHVTFRADLGFFRNVDWVMDGWTTDTIFAEVGPAVDLWNVVASVYSLDQAAARERVAAHPDEGWWFYTSCCAGEPAVGSPYLEGEALSLRTWGWVTFRYGLEGAVTWEVDGGRTGIDEASCWTDPMCSGYGINGDALLVYVGEPVGLPANQPVASIRLKNLRRGSQDHEYLWLLAEHDGSRERADAIAAQVVPHALDDGLDEESPPPGPWAHSPVAFEDARRHVADLLAGDSAPVAAFSWTPAVPAVGEEVRFHDLSTGGPTSWSWSFGDGGSAGGSDPTHAYAEAGSYTVTLTASNDAGSSSASRTLAVEGGGGSPPVTDPGAHAYLVPASAKVAGALGTNWVTDLVLNQGGGSELEVFLFFLERERDNGSADGVRVVVPANASLKLEDVVASVLGRDGTSGAILVGGDAPLVVSSRTYNDQGEAGTYGQHIPGTGLGEALAEGQAARLVQLARTDDFRTNLGLASVSDRPVTVGVSFHAGSGEHLGDVDFALAPFGHHQENDVLARFGAAPLGDAFAVVRSDTAGALFFAYASVVDNRTGDPVFIPARR